MVGKRRQMIFAPTVNPNSFVFFFQKGDDGNSWSIRDYSIPHSTANPRYAHDFNFSVDDLWGKVVQHFDAPTHSTNDLSFWHQHTLELNRTYLEGLVGSVIIHAAAETLTSQRVRPAVQARPAFPIINRAKLDRHPKSRKPQDLNRMLFSNASEDWVTWTAFGLLESVAADAWWADLVALAKAENPRLDPPPGWEQTPEVRLWQTIASPVGYEKASRERMRSSGDSARVARSHDPKPVEGLSEIDVILRNRVMIVFAEAKLGSDISASTTYDPRRNQIVRNIDCVLDQAGAQVPMFWMLVRDTGSGRSYTQLLHHYRSDPDALASELPHHDPVRVAALAESLSLILWRDLVRRVVQFSRDSDHEETTSIKKELWLRVSNGRAP